MKVSGKLLIEERVPSLTLVALLSDCCVQFDYDGKTRIVEPHALGTSIKDGGLILRGVQVGGEASRALPSWNLFRVDKMDNFSVLMGLPSQAPRPDYVMDDVMMSEILCQIDLR